jgi:transcriptional regulator
MYLPKSFKVDDKATLHALMREHSFATLVTQREGAPFATHLPFLLKPEIGERGVLRGHMARANPQWQSMEGQSALVIFQGPHAYISPTWYGGSLNVPTWNYSAVHAYGTPRIFDQDQELRAFLEEIVQFYEAGQESPWSVDDAPEEFIGNLMKAIVGFEIEIMRLEGKWKLSQNKPVEEQEHVIARLRETGSPDNEAVAALMEAQVKSLRG